MNTTDLWREAIVVLAVVAGPFLIAALVVGLAVALLQTATQLQESVLAFVPKLVVVVVVLALGGPFLLDRLNQYSMQAIAVAAQRSEERL